MAKDQKQRKRHIPNRTCVGCRQTLPKRELMRVVRSTEGIIFDSTGKANGRGAYIHNKYACWEKALKGSLENALHASLTEADRSNLLSILESMPVKIDTK